MKKNTRIRLVIFFIILVLVICFFVFDLGRYLSFNALKEQLDTLQRFYADHRTFTWVFYFAVYILVTALSLPGAAVMTLAGGAMFGLAVGTILVSFASTIGATLAFVFFQVPV